MVTKTNKKEVEVVEKKEIKENIIQKSISEYAEIAYLEYAMSVVKGRAIPSMEDGLKPVHRRILYAMFKEGMIHSSVHKKSARVVGNVLGLYHPHGDQSVYEALVRQAQTFSVRYPLIDGQGNFGSRDGDSAASMRYSEAKLAPITQLYLDEIKDNCVDFIPNYDGSEIEPRFLTARVPFILLNGNPGIAVGMATDIPGHNIREVVSAVIAYLENENISLDEILTHIKGPDFSTGSQIISSPADIKKIYEEGRGSIRVRGKYKIEGELNKNWKLVFYEIPHTVSVKQVMEEIDSLFNPEDKMKKDAKGVTKKISVEQLKLKTLITSLIGKYTDASDKDNPVRLVIEPKSMKQKPEELIQTLLAYTSLETNISTNFVVIGRDGRPVQKNLMEIIYEWTDFRLETIQRRVKYHLEKIAERLHILEGRKIILNHIDEVIKIIKNSENPKEDLMKKYTLSEIQAQDVLELRLRQIGKLELDSIVKEMNDLTKRQNELLKIISTPKTLKKQMIKELQEDVAKFGDDRITEITFAEKTDHNALEEKTSNLVQEDVTVAISTKGWVKVLKGVKEAVDISFKEGDAVDYTFLCKNTDILAFFDIDGKVYNYPIIDLNSKEGTPINTLGQMGAKLKLAFPISKDNKYLLVQDSGYGFIVNSDSLMTRVKAGKELFSIADNGNILMPIKIDGDKEKMKVALITTDNKFLMYGLQNVSEISKGKGVVLCGLAEGQKIKEIKLLAESCEKIEFATQSKLVKEKEISIENEDFKSYEKGRSTKGTNLPLKDKTIDIKFK